MKQPKKNLTHAELAKALGVSRSYVSRLCRFGMPTDSVEAARDWIESRSEELGTAPSSKSSLQSLTDQRREKLRLECEILALKLERERDAVELVPVGEIDKFIKSFIAWSQVNFTLAAQSITPQLAGLTEPQIYETLRPIFWESLFTGITGFIVDSRNAPDPRLTAYAETAIRKHFSTEDPVLFEAYAGRIAAIIEKLKAEGK